MDPEQTQFPHLENKNKDASIIGLSWVLNSIWKAHLARSGAD